jgi:PAS domain S-box-containing protein
MQNQDDKFLIEEKIPPSHIRDILFWLSLLILAGMGIILILELGDGLIEDAVIVGIGMIPILIASALTQRGRVEAAGFLIASSLTVSITALATNGEGIYDIGVMAYPAILIIASLILRKNAVLYLTALIVACTAWLVLGAIYGLYQPLYPQQTHFRQLVIAFLILLTTMSAVYALSNTVRNSLIAAGNELIERRKAQQALLKAEELYRNMVECTSVITYRDTVEMESETIYISPQIKDLLGYSQEEWREDPKLWLKITHPDDLETVRKMIAQCIETGERTVCEYRLLSKIGNWVWFRDESMLIKDQDNRPQYIQGVLIEITDRKQAEQKVLQREMILGAVAQTAELLLKSSDWRNEVNRILEFLGKATGASHVYIFENHTGPEGVMLSSQTYEWTAPGAIPELENPIYQNTRLIPVVPGLEDWYANLSRGKPFYGSKQQYPEYWQRVFDESGLKTLLDVPIFVNGHWWGIIGFDDFNHEMPWSRAEINALVAAAGNLATAIERQQADDALRASEQKFQQTFHHTYVSMAISRTTDNTLIDVNDAFCKVTGYSRQEAIGKRAGRDLKIWAHQKDRDFILQTLEKKGYIDEYRAEFRRKNGEIGVGLLSAVSIPIAGEVCQLFTFYDISQMDQLLNELQAKNEELQSFTFTVSHDLKAPLVTISGFLGYLAQDVRKGDVEKVNRDISRITEAVAKMQRLLNELLELSRIGRFANPPEVVPFEEILNDALAAVEGRLQARQVQVSVEAGLPSVYGDRLRLVQVVQNLVDNAAKFMGHQPHPLIEIGATYKNGMPIFYVRDNGIGVAVEHHEKIFGLFNKLDMEAEGTGIGLALVKRIVEVHGGRVWVESNASGAGATFCFTLANQPAKGGS